MDLAPSPTAREHAERLGAFMESHIYPAEAVYTTQRAELVASGQPHVARQELGRYEQLTG